MEHRRVVAMLVMCGVLLGGAIAPSWTGPAPIQSDVPFDEGYSLESRTAIGAHHLCSGIWVVGRDYKRTPEQVLADDIAPFRAFGWERSFEYEVDEERRRVTVSSPTTMPRTAVYNGDQGCTILARGEESRPLPADHGPEKPSRRRDYTLADGRCRRNHSSSGGRGYCQSERSAGVGDEAGSPEHAVDRRRV